MTRQQCASLTGIDIANHARARTDAADAAAREVAAAALRAADVAADVLRGIDAQIADLRHRADELHAKRDQERRQRGDAVVAGESSATANKTIRALEHELEQIGDAVGALRRRREAAQAETDAADLRERSAIAAATVLTMRLRLPLYEAARSNALKALAQHRAAHPVEESR